jgi:hypothetical protein
VKQFIADVPMRRFGEPEEIGELVLFLCSDFTSRSRLGRLLPGLLVFQIGKLKRYSAMSIQGIDLNPVDPEVRLTQFSDLLCIASGVLRPHGTNRSNPIRIA